MAKAVLLTQDGESIYPQTVPSQVVDPETGRSVAELMQININGQIATVVESLPTSDIKSGIIYLVETQTAGTYTQWVYDGAEWHNKGDWTMNVNIADNLTTDDANTALSAKQGKVLDGKASQLEAEINGSVSEITQTTSEYATDSGYGISAVDGTKPARTSWYASDFIAVPGGVSAKFLSWTATTYGIAFYSSNNEASFISGVIGNGAEQSIVIPSNAQYYRICDYGSSRSGYLKYQMVVVGGLIDRISSLETTCSDIQDDIDTIQDDIDTIQDILNPAEYVDIQGWTSLNEFISAGGVWTNGYSSQLYPVSLGDTFKIKANSSNYAIYAWLASDAHIVNTPPDYMAGETGRHTDISANTEAEITSPGNGYLYVFTGKSYDPQYIKKKTTTTIGEEIAEVSSMIDDAVRLNLLDGKAIVGTTDTILGLGASFMRGDAVGQGNNNTWLHTMASKIGCNVYNDALGGTNICYHANRLFNGTILGTGIAPIDNVSAVLIMHTHNKDVFTLPEPFASYSVADYEANVLPFQTTTGDSLEDIEYAKAFDYCIKKIIALYKDKVSSIEYVSSVASYMGTYVPKPCQIILATHWHDARTIYNASVRKLALKWGIPLVRFDDKIGFTKDQLNPSTGAQASIEYVGNVGGASPLETINGVVYGWHPMCGSADVYIQRKMASIAKDSFELI